MSGPGEDADEMHVHMYAALRDIAALGTAEERHNALCSVARAAVSARYEVARRKAAEQMRLDGEDRIATDDVWAEAVRATAEGR